MNKVLEYYNQGFNCAESIVKAFNEEQGFNIPVQIASPFGTGMAVGTTCGAIIGAIIALGALKGREEATAKNEARRYAKEILKQIEEKYGTFECIELKKKGILCQEIINDAYNILMDKINLLNKF